MANLIAGLGGQPTTTQQRGSQTFKSQREPLGIMRPLLDVLQRNLLGPSVALPETPISIPLQQAISATQDVMPTLMNRAFGPNTNLSLAQRMAGRGIPAENGAPEFGRLQTREELGLPARREYFPFTPTEEEMTDVIGLPPMRTIPPAKRGMRQVAKLEKRETGLEERIARRSEAGKGTAAAERRLAKVQGKLARKRARYE